MRAPNMLFTKQYHVSSELSSAYPEHGITQAPKQNEKALFWVNGYGIIILGFRICFLPIW